MAKLKLTFLDKYEGGDSNNLLSIITERALEVVNYSEGYFTYSIGHGESNEIITDISLYIIATEISFNYRPIYVEILSLNEVKVTFFTLMTKQADSKNVDISADVKEFNNVIYSYLSSQLFNEALRFLISQIHMKRQYKDELKKSIIVGQAKTIKLDTGEEFIAGFKKIDGKNVYFFTGKGLREIYKPGNTELELKKARELEGKDEKFLIENGYLDYVSIDEIAEIY